MTAAKPGKPAKIKLKVKTKGAKGARKAKKAGKADNTLDGIAKVIDHPLVGEILAAGALAAMAAVAEHQLAGKKGAGATSSKLVKAAGKAAAAAIGARLMSELGPIRDAAAKAAKNAAKNA